MAQQTEKGHVHELGLQWGRNHRIKGRRMRLAGGPQSGSAFCTTSNCAFPGEEQSPEEGRASSQRPAWQSSLVGMSTAWKPDLLGLVPGLNPVSLVFSFLSLFSHL